MEVGDNVGDCAARGADLFESIAAEIISAMILGGTMAQRCKIEGKCWFLCNCFYGISTLTCFFVDAQSNEVTSQPMTIVIKHGLKHRVTEYSIS